MAFSFCHVLDFQMIPRFKAIHAQKLYHLDVRTQDSCLNL
ncbi:Tn3 family transposase [Bacillus cereus]|nr:Tn3 family transposase [Bacillus cereus]